MTKRTRLLARLHRTKSTLDDAIGEELRRPRPDSLHLRALKTRKLRVKDGLATLLRGPATPA